MKKSRSPLREVQWWICAVFLLALGLFLRLQGLDRSMWLDEFQSVYGFANLLGARHNLMELRHDIHPPIYFLMLQLWQRLGAHTEASMRLLTVAISMVWMALALVWLKSYHRSAALIAGLIFATQPFLIRYGQEIKNYALLVLSTVVMFWFTSCFLRNPRNRRYAIFAGLAAVFAIGTHMIAIFLPAAILVFALTATLVRPGGETGLEEVPASSTGIPGTVRDLVPLAVSVIPVPAAAAFLMLRYFFIDVQQQGTWIPPASIHQLASVASTLLQIANLPKDWRPIALGLLLLITSAAVAFGNWRRSLPFLTAAIGYCLQILVYSLWARSLFVGRYLLPGTILFVAWLSMQLATIRSRHLRWFTTSCLALLAAMFSLSWVRYQAAIPIEAWKELKNVLPHEVDSSTRVLVQPDYCYWIFRSYSPAYPEQQIVKVPAGDTAESFLRQHEFAGISHAILVTRISDVTRTTPALRDLLTALRRELVRPAMVEIYLVGPTGQELSSTFLPLAETTLGEPAQASSDQTRIGVARFELPKRE